MQELQQHMITNEMIKKLEALRKGKKLFFFFLLSYRSFRFFDFYLFSSHFHSLIL